MTMHRFEGRSVLVTGGASGIGAAAVQRFLDEGARVAAIDLSEPSLARFAATLDVSDERLLTVACDVGDSASVEEAVKRVVAQFGAIDVVVNNAGVGGLGRAGEVSDEDWHRVMAVDLNGVFHVARATLPHLVASKGNLINTASVSGLAGDRMMVAYNTAKGGVVNFTRATAVDYGRDGVRVNAVCPGPVRTPILASVLGRGKIADQYRERIPLGRVAEPQDIAAVIAFLASDDAAFVHGVNLPVDGGLSAWTGQPDIALLGE